MNDNLWTYFHISWTFLTKLCASVPSDPHIVKAWTESRQPTHRPAGGKSIDDIQEEVLASLEEPGPPSILVFQRSDNKLVVRAGTIKAHIKDCARVISGQFVGKIRGERSFATRVINGVYPDEREYWIPILRPNGKPVTAADGTHDKAVHARGPHGQPINALKSFEYVEPARIDFTLKVLGPSVSDSDLAKLFSYGGTHGYAGERGDGEGRYVAKVEKVRAPKQKKAA